jgi:hypothetical protein
MHKKYAKDGFVALSVVLDDPDNADSRKATRAFLEKTEKDAPFTNLWLNGGKDFDPSTKLGSAAPPLVFVFDREGRIAKKYKGFKDVDYDEIEKFVADLLKK